MVVKSSQRLSDRIRHAQRTPGETMASWIGLAASLIVVQILLLFVALFLGNAAIAPIWAYIEPLYFPLCSWRDADDYLSGGTPFLALLIQIPLALIAMFLPPTWALWRVRGAERFPFFRTLGVHAVLCLLFYGLFRACGFVVYWDTM